MDLLNEDVICVDVTPPSHVEAARDEVATSCVASCDTDYGDIRVTKRTHEKMNKCLDSERGKWLLAAARRVRDQKQRPNIDRIMNSLRIICPGQFQSRESLTEELELAVSEGILLRVGAAGDNENCSYRDPGRVVRLKSHSLHVSRDLDMTKIVARSVRELADQAGSTPADLHRYIRSAYNVQIHDDSDLVAMIAKYCQKAVEVGKLVAVEDGDETRYRAVYATKTKNSSANCTKTLLSSLSTSSHALFDRAFKTDVSENCDHSR